MTLKPIRGANQKAGGSGGLLIGKQLHVGHTAVVIQAYVQGFSARPATPPGAVAMDAMAHPQRLDIQMNLLAGSLALVRDHGWPGLQVRQGIAIQTQAPQLKSHRGKRHGKGKRYLWGESMPTRLMAAMAAPRLTVRRRRLRRGRELRSRRASCSPALWRAGQPFVDRASAYTQPLCHFPGTLSLLQNSLHDQNSTIKRGPGILMEVVHTALPAWSR